MATKEKHVATKFLACLGLFLYRFRQCAFYGPATLQAFVKCFLWYAKLVHPSSQALRAAFVFNKSICSRVASLLFWRGPSAVFRIISLRSINPIYAVRCGWLWSHIVIEVLKRLPSLAYYFSCSAVKRKGIRVLVIATLLHAPPGIVFWRAVHSVLSLTACRAAVTAVSSQVRAFDRLFCSTLAKTYPVDMLTGWMFFCFADNCPFAKLLSSQVYKVAGAASRIIFSHDFVLLKQVVVRSAWALQRPGCLHFSSLLLVEQR